MCVRNQKSERGAFTLIELLVAMSIIVTIATLAVFLMPHITERTKATRAADNVQGWLLIARHTSLRDRVPRGLRLIIDPTTGYVNTLQYIEQPDSIQVGQLSAVPNNPQQVDIVGFDGSGGLGLGNQALWPVQPGDYLQIQGGPSLLILAVTPNVGNTPIDTVLTTNSPPNAPQAGYTNNFSIIRAPRPRPSEKPMDLPTDIVIDMNRCYPPLTPAQTPYASTLAGATTAGPSTAFVTTTPVPPLSPGSALIVDPQTPSQETCTVAAVNGNTITVLATQYNHGAGAQVQSVPQPFDIMFAPSGSVVGTLGGTTGKIILWMRDSTQDPINPGHQALITVYTRTGLIAAHQVNIAGPDPYFYTRDPRNSGM
jgi:prepilin-type N-terminal cleavage/methylation domain-containing protein